MATPSTYSAAVLQPAVDAVRRVLRQLEPNEVPKSLRRVAASSGGRLAPPLIRSVLVELDRNEWLRGKAADELGDDAPAPVAAFLANEPGWWLKLVDTVAGTVAEQSTADPAGAVADLESRLAEAKRRSTDLRDERDRLAVESRSLRRELRDRPGAHTDDDRLVAELSERTDRLEGQLAAEREARAGAEARLAEIRRRTARRSLREGPVRPAPAERSGGFADPVAAARRLDLDIAALAAAVPLPEPIATPGSAPAPVEAVAVAVPAGVAPDSAEAISWLVGLPTPVTVVVDGYNVTYLIDPDHFSTGDLRRRLVGAVARLRRRASSPHRVVVVFDSGEFDEGAPEIGPGGVEVRFSPANLIADDEIVALADEVRGPVVVISNDRELRDRSEAVGAITLWGVALVDWLGS